MNREIIRDIKERVSAIDVCNKYGVAVNRAGFACCLFHQEKTPSMRVYPGSGGFHCFGCHEGGSIIDLVMQLFSVSLDEACVMIDRDFSLGLDAEHADEKRRSLSRAEQLELAKQRYLERKKKEREQEKAKARLEALETAYFEAEQEVINLFRQKAMFDPRRNSDVIKDEYALSVRKLPLALYNAEEAESELYEFLGIGKKQNK